MFFGEFDVEAFDAQDHYGTPYPYLNYSLFFMVVVFVALVMMNLLISLISDSYANVQSNFREYLVRERASLILVGQGRQWNG